MPDIARLHTEARRIYERGRTVAAVRVAAVVIPLLLLCARETGEWRRCGAIGAVLLVVTIVARWRLPHGMRAVDAGMLTGVIPMTAALIFCRFARGLPAGAALSVCAAAGFVSGALAGWASAGSTDTDWPQWVTEALVAGLTAALGCIGIGLGAAIGGAAAIAIGTIVAVRLPRDASA
jgi:hypothetical protein